MKQLPAKIRTQKQLLYSDVCFEIYTLQKKSTTTKQKKVREEQKKQLWKKVWKTYKLHSKKNKDYISGHKETELQGTPLPISKNMHSQVVRSLTGCTMSECKPFLH